jgi:hypothetical protein
MGPARCDRKRRWSPAQSAFPSWSKDRLTFFVITKLLPVALVSKTHTHSTACRRTLTNGKRTRHSQGQPDVLVLNHPMRLCAVRGDQKPSWAPNGLCVFWWGGKSGEVGRRRNVTVRSVKDGSGGSVASVVVVSVEYVPRRSDGR